MTFSNCASYFSYVCLADCAFRSDCYEPLMTVDVETSTVAVTFEPYPAEFGFSTFDVRLYPDESEDRYPYTKLVSVNQSNVSRHINV